jgi:hypothetical protein
MLRRLALLLFLSLTVYARDNAADYSRIKDGLQACESVLNQLERLDSAQQAELKEKLTHLQQLVSQQSYSAAQNSLAAEGKNSGTRNDASAGSFAWAGDLLGSLLSAALWLLQALLFLALGLVAGGLAGHRAARKVCREVGLW